jgi:Mu-like prophage I protein
MPELLVLADIPEELTLAEGKVVSQVQIAKTGSFKDPRYGNFSITKADLVKWVSNFTALDKSNGRLGLPIDVDHGPETTGNTEAAGWITHLRISVDGTELWATAEWNDLGKELVSKRRYAYLSPSYVANYKNETGKEFGTKLIGVGLTNRPFLSMATVSLSRFHSTESYTPELNMPYPKPFLDALGLAEDADEATVLAKVAELQSQPQPKPKTLAEMAAAEGVHVLTADQYASLAQSASEGAAAAKALKDQRFELAWSSALNDTNGARVVPAQKEIFQGMYEKDADSTVKLMDSLQPVVAAVPVGSGSAPPLGGDILRVGDEQYAVDDDANALAEKAAALCAADSNLDYGDAVVLAAQQMGI